MKTGGEYLGCQVSRLNPLEITWAYQPNIKQGGCPLNDIYTLLVTTPILLPNYNKCIETSRPISSTNIISLSGVQKMMVPLEVSSSFCLRCFSLPLWPLDL